MWFTSPNATRELLYGTHLELLYTTHHMLGSPSTAECAFTTCHRLMPTQIGAYQGRDERLTGRVTWTWRAAARLRERR